jgi:polyisoprenoid-binding protein YceI
LVILFKNIEELKVKKIFYAYLIVLASSLASAQTAVVDVSLSPAGSFKVTSSDVKGFAEKTGDSYTAKNIVVGLKDLKTGIDLRDEHTKKYLDVAQFPEATLVSAQGSNGKGEGLIKIKGIEKKIEGTYEATADTLTAMFELNYQDFKISKAKYMGVGVRDVLKLTVSVPIKKGDLPAAKAVPAKKKKK